MKKQIIRDNTEPPKNYVWVKTDLNNQVVGVFEWLNGKWEQIDSQKASSIVKDLINEFGATDDTEIEIGGETKTIGQIKEELTTLQGQVETMSTLYNKANKMPDIIDFFLAVYPEIGHPNETIISTMNYEYAAKDTSKYTGMLNEFRIVSESAINTSSSASVKTPIFPFSLGTGAYGYIPKDNLFYELSAITAERDAATIIQTDLSTNTETTVRVEIMNHLSWCPVMEFDQMNQMQTHLFFISAEPALGETAPAGFPTYFMGIANCATTPNGNPAVYIQDNPNIGGRIL